MTEKTIEPTAKKQKDEPKKTLGMLSMIFGIIGLVLCALTFLDLPFVIASIVLGIIALVKINKKQDSGKGMAIAGLITGGVALLLIVCIAIFAIGATKNFFTDNIATNPTNIEEKNSDKISGNANNPEKKEIGFNESFIFDELEIKILSEYTFTKVDNKFSDDYGKSIVKLPIYVKNLADETHGLNMFDYEIYGPNGIKIDNDNTYFDDESIDYAGDLRSGASYTKYVFFPYDGDGTYAIEFDDWATKKTVEFKISK